jgi:hypothetical protein
MGIGREMSGPMRQVIDELLAAYGELRRHLAVGML